MATRLALITGGMGGLGETISTKMADAGYRVAVTYSPSNKTVDRWTAEMKSRGYDFRTYACNVTDFESCKTCVDGVTLDLGHVDILVNNAGITRDMTFRKMTKGDWDAVLHTNLDSVFNMSKQVCDAMVDHGWGRIINVSSVNGSKGAFGQTNYAAAKAGMHGFTKSLALEVAKKGGTVNTISPGYIGTKMSVYITLVDVKKLVVEGEEFQVLDAKTGEDLTRSILLQIILEEEAAGAPMFSSDVLSQFIRSYGNAMQGMLGTYLERNMQLFAEMQKSLREQSQKLYGDPTKLNEDLWKQFMSFQGPAMQNLVSAYLDQSRNVFLQMQEQLQNQTRTMFSGFPFPGFSGVQGFGAQPGGTQPSGDKNPSGEENKT